MGSTLLEKILENHLVFGSLKSGDPIGIKVDQTVLQDNNGPLALLEFEAIGVPRVKTSVSVAYLDHNTYQFNRRNSEDHDFIRTASSKFGLTLSRLGNGICHQIHREQFAVPGQIVLGSDSHTPTAGGIGMLGFGAGGLDVVAAMAGAEYWLRMPEQIQVRLSGRLSPWVTAKDVILTLLKHFTVKGGVGKSFEFTGPGVGHLDISERCTITNMTAEMGATTAIFPSDHITRNYLISAGREDVWKPLEADRDANYSKVIEINLSEIEPMIALPSMPDFIVPVREVEGKKVDQVIIGSCTNGSYRDLLVSAKMLKGKIINKDTDMIISPASQLVNQQLAEEGLHIAFIEAGANLTMSMCGACIGAGHVPSPDSISLRTFNRNFKGRSGLENDSVYLCSSEVATASAITGMITDPRNLGDYPLKEFADVSRKWSIGLIPPQEDGETIEIKRGENIAPLPSFSSLPDNIEKKILIKLGDNITTDHIVPSSTETTIFRSNIPRLSEFTLSRIDREFAHRAVHESGGIIIAGNNYGVGSSREHAALCPLYLNVRVIISKSFARIHQANLINFGILPLEFVNEEDYNRLQPDMQLLIEMIPEQLQYDEIDVKIVNSNERFKVRHQLSLREKEIILSGGLLLYLKKMNNG